MNAVLDQSSCLVAIRANYARNQVVVTNDLERAGQRWRIINASDRKLAVDNNEDDLEDKSVQLRFVRSTESRGLTTSIDGNYGIFPIACRIPTMRFSLHAQLALPAVRPLWHSCV